MKKILLFSFIALLAMPAAAQILPYVALRGGLEKSTQNIEGYDLFNANNVILSPALGVNFNNKARLELAYSNKNDSSASTELDYRDQQGIPLGNSVKTEQQSVLLNAFVYPFDAMAINPFVGLGVGWGEAELTLPSGSRTVSGNGIAWALYAGADYNITPALAIEFMLTYNSVIDAITAETIYPGDFGLTVDNVQNYGALLGIRYIF